MVASLGCLPRGRQRTPRLYVNDAWGTMQLDARAGCSASRRNVSGVALSAMRQQVRDTRVRVSARASTSFRCAQKTWVSGPGSCRSREAATGRSLSVAACPAVIVPARAAVGQKRQWTPPGCAARSRHSLRVQRRSLSKRRDGTEPSSRSLTTCSRLPVPLMLIVPSGDPVAGLRSGWTATQILLVHDHRSIGLTVKGRRVRGVVFGMN